MKTIVRGIHIIILIALISSAIGCTQQELAEETEKMVISAEKLSKTLNNELDYQARLKKDEATAFTSPDGKLISDVEKAVKTAETTMKDIKDDEVKAKLDKRVDAVKDIVADAKAIRSALEKGTDMNEKEKAFSEFLTASPLSAELEAKVTAFETLLADKETIMKELPKDWQKAFETNVVKDGISLLENAKTVLTVRSEYDVLSKMITDKVKNADIEKKIADIKALQEKVAIESVKTALNAKITEITKPYVDRVAEEKAKAEAEAKKKTATNTNTGSKPSGSTTKPSSTGGSTGGSVVNQPISNDPHYLKVYAVCTQTYGLETSELGTCRRNATDIAIYGSMVGMVGGDKAYPNVLADVCYALGAPATKSELRQWVGQASRKEKLGDFPNGIRITFGNKFTVVVQW